MKQDASALPVETVFEVRDRCLCLISQRAARKVARRFDIAFRPLGITNGQFSLMVALAAPKAWNMTQLADFLGMDRTTLTAAVATLKRRKLVKLITSEEDQRAKRVLLTPSGQKLTTLAVPVWRAEHERLDQELTTEGAAQVRSALLLLAAI